MSKVADKTLQDVTEQALQAAQLATEAAHEAEAAITARNDAAVALGKTAQQTRIVAMGTAAAAVIMLAMGGVFWARAASHLSQAAEVQASATAGFVENLMQMNDALDQMQAVIASSQEQAVKAEQSMDVVIARLDQRLAELAQDMGERLLSTEQDAAPNSALLVALAEVELNLTRQLAALPLAPQATPPAPSASTSPPPSPAAPRQTAARPTARTAPPPPNPFRFP